MGFILWPAFSDAASNFSHRGVAARLLQRVGTLTTVYDACMLFLSLLFPPDFYREFCSCSMHIPLSTFQTQPAIFCLANSLGNKKGLT